MAPDEHLAEQYPSDFAAGIPPLEDATEPELAEEQEATEDAVEEVLLDHEARAIPSGEASASEGPDAPPALRDDDLSDVAHLPDIPILTSTSSRTRRKGDWECELSAQAVAVELRHIEATIRTILEERDPKRKRKLSGTHRWQELEDDVLSWYGAGRFDEATLRELRSLIHRRHYLFRHLNFMASTRPTWNT
jgi:hypothetical protein